MADDASLLLRIKGDSTGGTKAVAETRAAIASLRTASSKEFGAMQSVANSSLSQITSSMAGVAGQVPILGGAINSLSGGLSTMAGEGTAAAGSLASIAGPAAFAVAGILATVTAVGSLAKGLFNLTEQAADFRGKLFDLGQQTGVSVETLNALDISASKTGGSIESVSQSLVIFEGHLDAAQDASSDMGKKFAELKISTDNTEEAFRDALKALAAMPEGFHQTNEAAELFGRRGGKQVLAILKETKGDVDSAVTSLGGLAKVTTEEAKLADDFNDSLRDLHILLRGVTAIIGTEIMPVALRALNDLKKALSENADGIKAVGVAAGLLSQLFTLPLKGAIDVVTAAWLQHKPEVEFIAAVYERLADAAERFHQFKIGLSGVGGAADGVFNVSGGFGSPEVGGAANVNLPGTKGVFKIAMANAGDAAQRELEIQRNLRETLALEFEKRNSDLDAHFKQLQKLADDHLATVNKQIAAERAALQAGYEQGAIDLAEFTKRKGDLDLKATEEKNKRDEETRRLAFEKQLALDQQELDERAQKSALEETSRRGQLNRLIADIDHKGSDERAAAEAYVITRELGFLKDASEERIGIINFELTALSTSTERKKQLDIEKKIAEEEYTSEFKRLTQLRIDILAKEDFDRRNLDAQGATRQRLSGNRERRVTDPALIDTSAIPTSAVDQLFLAVDNNLTGSQHTEALAGLQAMSEAFSGLGQAVGQVVESFVLYGSAGTSVRKVTAQILASIAQQAAVKAVFELAEGFAALALAYFGIPNAGPSAAAHFTAAATYGAIAGVAAIVGRQAAGGSFTDKGSSAGSSGGGRAASASPSTPTTREVDRRAGGQPGGATLTIRLPHGWLGDELKKDYDLNGYSRLLITTGG